VPALRKPHRVAVLMPEIGLEGPDLAYEREAALLMWVACIETLQRHPGLAVYDPESTPLVALDGHFVPQHAGRGASPIDAFYAPARRDELVWLEAPLSKTGAVRLHTLARDGSRQSFDALGRNVGDQIQQVMTAWLSARGLGLLPNKFDTVEGSEILAVVRVIGPVLVEKARSWTTPIVTIPEVAEKDDDDEVGDPDAATTMKPVVSRPGIARALAQRLPATLKVPALRVLELALDDELDDLIIAVDREHPQSLFARFIKTAASEPDFALLRRVIASAPGWAHPYAYLVSSRHGDPLDNLVRPTRLEQGAGAGIAALIRPANLDILDTAADRLRDDGRVDEAVRLLERGTTLDGDDPRAHLLLLHGHAHTDRIGVWLAQAHQSSRMHGCPMDPALPWYPDQILIDLHTSDALLDAGRLDEAIALRSNRLDGREASWPRHAKILDSWRKDPRFVAWCYAREGYFRGDEARAAEGFGRIEPADSVDLAIFLDSLVALGRDNDAVLAWAHYGLGRGLTRPGARLAAARALMAAGDWRRGVEEMWRVELTEPGRDDEVAISRIGLLMSCAPIEVFEAALAERLANGARMLARRMARDVADFVPGAMKSSVVMRALGKTQPIDFDHPVLDGFAPDTHSRAAIDELFASIANGKASELVLADRLVARWLEVVFDEVADDDPRGLAQAGAYTAAHAIAAYLAATTRPPSVFAGAYRSVAAEALALVGRHRAALSDRDARALFGAIEPVIRRVDRWISTNWLALAERSTGLDERSAGDLAGFLRDHVTVAARVLGPEEVAVLAASVARLHRERPEGWASAVAAQAQRLATHTGRVGVDEWADAVVTLLEVREIDHEEAVDALHTAAYLADGTSAVPSLLAARVLFTAGRGSAAFAILCSGLGASDTALRDAKAPALAAAWKIAKLDVPFEFDKAAAMMFEALQKGDPARAEKAGRWAVAFDPNNAEAHRNLGLALAQQGKIIDALHHLVRGSRDQATQILSGVLYQAGKLPDAMTILDYASRWYTRADQWLTYGGIAYAAMDNPRCVKAYALAYQLDPESFDASQLNAYAGVLDEVGDYATCEKVANHLLRIAGDDLTWKTNGWNHLACALNGQGRFDEAARHAEAAVTQNPVPENATGFAETFARAKARTSKPVVAAAAPSEPVMTVLDSGDFPELAAKLADPSWRVRRAALHASRYRFASENQVEVTPRAIAAATAIIDDSTASTDRDTILARMLALQIREQAYFARDPLPRLGDRMTREAFYKEFRARGGIVLGDAPPAKPAFVDRTVVPGSKVSRASDYVALLRDLAALSPREALAQFDLDDNGYIEVARAWAQAMERDPTIARTIAAGLAKR
jgi:tetratricopeptide (TPR) repeat protein